LPITKKVRGYVLFTKLIEQAVKKSGDFVKEYKARKHETKLYHQQWVEEKIVEKERREAL
jgi:hypothetical protein